MSRQTRGIYASEPQNWRLERVRLWLGNASSVRNPGAIATVNSETGAFSQVTLLGGAASDTVPLGAAWFFALNDRAGNALDPARPWSMSLVLEVINAPPDTSDLWLAMGITDTAALTGSWRHGGLCWDAAGGPLMRAGHQAAYTDADQNVNTKHAVVTIEHGPASIQQVRVWGLSTTGASIAGTTRTGSWGLGTPPVGFVAMGRKTAIAGAATVKFRAWTFEVLQPDGYLP